MLTEEQKLNVAKGMTCRDSNRFDGKTIRCCPSIKHTEAISCWPPFYKDGKTQEKTWDLFIKISAEKIKVCSIHYKLSKKTLKLSAFQIKYSHGIQMPVIKASNETEDDMQILTLAKKQYIARLFLKKTDEITLEYQFVD